MHVESKVIVNLIRTAQNERFNENKLSGLVYEIRIKKYNERLQEIKRELPGLEKRYREGQHHKHKKAKKHSKNRKTANKKDRKLRKKR